MSNPTKNLSLPTVAILMCTYNGEKFLKAQIESIQNQTFKNWALYISDDGSKDKTIEIIHSFKKTLGKKLILLKGPQKGYVENFIFITKHVSAHYYFWSDQDDVWRPKKIERALFWLQKQSPLIPNLYCGRSYLSDSHNKIFGLSPLFKKPLSFKNAIIQNIGSGNTMAFNKPLKDLLVGLNSLGYIVTHDWLLYQITTAFHGNLFYDPIPYINYRQHSNNAIGMSVGLKSTYQHFILILSGRLKERNSNNFVTLSSLNNMPQSSKAILDQLIAARKKSTFAQLKIYLKLGIYRQSFSGQIGLYFSILFAKF